MYVLIVYGIYGIYIYTYMNMYIRMISNFPQNRETRINMTIFMVYYYSILL